MNEVLSERIEGLSIFQDLHRDLRRLHKSNEQRLLFCISWLRRLSRQFVVWV